MIEQKRIRIGELEFDYRVFGEEKNELIIFLHGFPETSIMWSELMTDIAALGFYCIAPDMRGYSKNACPKGIKNYTVQKIGDDILERINLLGNSLADDYRNM